MDVTLFAPRVFCAHSTEAQSLRHLHGVGGFDFQRVVVGWKRIHDGASAEEFAYLLSQAPIGVGPYTSISGAIEFALPLFENNGITSERRTIDISGDGPNNSGDYVTNARDRAIRAGVTINGLPIVNNRPSPWGRMPMPNLDLYYRNCVIGARSFLVVATAFQSFGPRQSRSTWSGVGR